MRSLFVIVAVIALLAGCACGKTTSGPDGSVAADGGGHLECPGTSAARCEGACVNTAADPAHCGACKNACPPGAVCEGGECACPPMTLACDSVCVNPLVDSDHCGGCGIACAPGEACVEGTCVTQCPGGQSACGSACVDLNADEAHCGACNMSCTEGRACESGICRCPSPTASCLGQCVDITSDVQNCGGCGTQCFGGFVCSAGKCECPSPLTACTAACVDTQTDVNNCGGCSVFCQVGQTCTAGVCETPCPTGQVRCNGLCVDPQTDWANCGGCGLSCGALSCQGGACTACNSATTDCDSDGWTVADGDCCDSFGACGAAPDKVNPGAFEVPANGVDDNCNSLVDAADTLDVRACDTALPTNSTDAKEYARALGVCRDTTETAPLPQRTWGLIDARLLQADGSPLQFSAAASIRTSFGAQLLPMEGRSVVVLSTGIASDGTQTNPGPNGGPVNTSIPHASGGVDIQSCGLPYCISDWFAAPNPPLKLANRLPEAPGCQAGTVGVNVANDSVMLVLRLRAPTNARAFQFNGYFLSSEYPEYVCTLFNDQLVALVDTPGGAPAGAPNPPDKNLMTYAAQGQRWPVGINVARGTPLFKVCQPQAQSPACWDPDVSAASCANGPGELTGTGFEAPMGQSCTNGGGTGWLVTTGNVRPGEIVELRVALWDVGDHILDSLALLDGFRWLEKPGSAGTTD